MLGWQAPGTCWTRTRVGTRNLYFTSFPRGILTHAVMRTSGLGQRGNFSVKGQTVHIWALWVTMTNAAIRSKKAPVRQYELHGRGCVPIKLY